MTYLKLIDPHEEEPTLNALWTHEGTCKVGSNIRIAQYRGWVVIERHGAALFQPKTPFGTFKAALEYTQGKTLGEDREMKYHENDPECTGHPEEGINPL